MILIWVTSITFSIGLSIIILAIGITFRKIVKLFRLNNSPLECGFSSRRENRNFIAFRFFIFAVVFLIFDVELILLIPYLYREEGVIIHTLVFILVVNLLICGLLLE